MQPPDKEGTDSKEDDEKTKQCLKFMLDALGGELTTIRWGGAVTKQRTRTGELQLLMTRLWPPYKVGRVDAPIRESYP